VVAGNGDEIPKRTGPVEKREETGEKFGPLQYSIDQPLDPRAAAPMGAETTGVRRQIGRPATGQ
jgi:hypothetical protein